MNFLLINYQTFHFELGLVPPVVGSYLPSEYFPEFARDYFMHCAAPPYSASIQLKWDGVDQTLWKNILADPGYYENFAEYVIFIYVSNCARSGHSHFRIGNRLTMIDNDRCFMPEQAFSNPGIPGDGVFTLGAGEHFSRLSEISDLIFSSDCKILRGAERLLFRIAAIHERGGLSSAFREVAKRDDLSDQLLQDARLMKEMDNRVSQLFSHLFACYNQSTSLESSSSNTTDTSSDTVVVSDPTIPS